MKHLYFLIFTSVHACLIAQGLLEDTYYKAQAYHEKNMWLKAIPLYRKCIAIDQSHIPSMIHLGLCYHKLHKNKEAMQVFEYLYKKKTLADTLLPLYVDCLKKMGAKAKYSTVIHALVRDDSTSKALKAEYDSIVVWQRRPHTASLVNLKDINTTYSELAPTLYEHKGLVYLSNYEGIFIKKRDLSTGMPNYNIYFSAFLPTDSARFRKRRLFSSEVNSLRQEGGICFSSDYNKVFYSRAFKEYDKTYRFKLYLSEKTKKSKGALKEFAFNDSTASFTHPNLSPDGRFFFFSSDMQGGYGGKDIYVCILIDSLWSEPINVGPHINTSKNEIFPHCTKSGNLYFSSNGHIGMGGYDLYKAIATDGEWNLVENMKMPVNSAYDEYAIDIVDAAEQKGYLSSNRPGGKGAEDLYSFEIKR